MRAACASRCSSIARSGEVHRRVRSAVKEATAAPPPSTADLQARIQALLPPKPAAVAAAPTAPAPAPAASGCRQGKKRSKRSPSVPRRKTPVVLTPTPRHHLSPLPGLWRLPQRLPRAASRESPHPHPHRPTRISFATFSSSPQVARRLLAPSQAVLTAREGSRMCSSEAAEWAKALDSPAGLRARPLRAAMPAATMSAARSPQRSPQRKPQMSHKCRHRRFKRSADAPSSGSSSKPPRKDASVREVRPVSGSSCGPVLPAKSGTKHVPNPPGTKKERHQERAAAAAASAPIVPLIPAWQKAPPTVTTAVRCPSPATMRSRIASAAKYPRRT
jgi:hypothetical protein